MLRWRAWISASTSCWSCPGACRCMFPPRGRCCHECRSRHNWRLPRAESLPAECDSVSRLRPLVSALALCSCCIALNGCIVAAIGGAAGGGYAVAQSSGASGGWNDGNIKNAIEDRWNETDPQIAHAVNLDVFQGRVMLTGDVPSPAVRDEAVADAWKVEGVTDVIN